MFCEQGANSILEESPARQGAANRGQVEEELAGERLASQPWRKGGQAITKKDDDLCSMLHNLLIAEIGHPLPTQGCFFPWNSRLQFLGMCEK